MPRTMTSRALFAALLEEEITEEVQDSEVRAPISRQILRKLLSEYGRAPAIAGAFNLYADLKDRFEDQVDGIEPPEDASTFYTDFRRAMRLLDSRVEQEGTRQYLSEAGTRIENLLRRLDNGHELSSGLWRDLIQQYAGVIQALSADKGIFTRTRRLPGGGAVRWLRIQKANPREEAKEKFRTEDPELYARLERGERQIREMNIAINEKVVKDGLVPERRLFNRAFKGGRVFGGTPAMTGRDPVTDEVLVYDIDGDILSPDEFVEKLRESSKQRKALGKINPARWMYEPKLDPMREHGPDELQEALVERGAEFKRVKALAQARPESQVLQQRLQELSPQYVSLTDDPDKESALTRVYPVVEIDGRNVVSSGRFRGIPQSSLTNSIGRQIEGSMWYLTKEDRQVRRSVSDSDGNVSFRRQRETYVTVEKGRLFLRTAPEKPYQAIREALKALSVKIPTIVKDGKRSDTNYYFEPKDYETVRDAVGTMALSRAASKLLEGYFEDLARAERAANATDLDRYSAESLGLRFPLRYQQTRALAWLDANGNKGICALDTGMGKTAVAIGSMINLLKQGKKGRFLFVCDTDLLGNLPKEIRKFLQPEEAAAMEKLVDVISYTEFSSERRADPDYGEQYVAIYWDEAHTKMNKKSKSAYEAAVNCPCEHKILLTASPMVKDPKEVYTMASVANSQDLRGRTPASKAELKFLNYYSTTVAGRTVGITQDPIAAKGFRTWTKRNLFYAEKTAVIEEEAKIEKLIRETVAITMEPDVAEAYLVEMAATREELQDLILKFKSAEIPEGAPEEDQDLIRELRENPALPFEKAQTLQSRPLKMLTMLSDTPDLVPGLEGARNPKVDASVAIIAPKMQIDGARTLMFAESKALAEQTFSRMRTEYSGVGHVLGLKNAIYYSGASGEVTKYTKGNFGRHVGKRDEKGKIIRERNVQTNKLEYINPLTDEPLNSDEWKTYILGQVLGLKKTRTDKNIRTAVLTGSYAVGQNLQSFGTVIHLDRDTWSNETMKQRTARAWRAGNKQKVEEYTLDMVLPVTMEPAQESLDQMRRVMQEIDSDLFSGVVLDSQAEKLGEEWYNMKRERSALSVVDRKMIERALSPYAKHIGSLEDMNNA